MIGRLFPDFADLMEARSAEAVESRLWSGIHFRSDIETGLTIGRKVGGPRNGTCFERRLIAIGQEFTEGNRHHGTCEFQATCGNQMLYNPRRR